jgi:hypothetical protein
MTTPCACRSRINAFVSTHRWAEHSVAFCGIHRFLWRAARVAALGLFGFVTVPAISAPMGDGFKVSVTREEIRFRWHGKGDETIAIIALPLATGQKSGSMLAQENAAGEEVWRGSDAALAAAIPRFVGVRDRVFAKYQLVRGGVNVSACPAQHVTEFDALPRRVHGLGSTDSKKGLTCVLDPADGMALGCAQLNQNIDIGGLLDVQGTSPKLEFSYEGRQIGLRPPAVAVLDAQLKAARKNGQRVTGILLNNVRPATPPSSPLVHPLTDPSRVPIGPSAFNTATEEGVFYYRAIVHWLVERYTREDAAFGWLSGLVVGNEMQSHWSWYHLGNADRRIVIREYAAALRVADLVARSLHAGFQIYVSLEHHWAMPASEDLTKGFSGMEALEGIQRISSEGGDFPWSLAFHPYPENLFKPEFWKDRSAPLRFDAPRITFKNLEVLPAFLKQPEYLFEGNPRTIALTEQGFHCPDGDEGEPLQAAAYALAWKKVQVIPEIESFLYHRHVDHPHEHGLRCGLRAHDGSTNVNGLGRERVLWQVFKSAGTAQEDSTFAFALPIIGRADWSNLVSSSFEPPRRKISEIGEVIYDFVLKKDSALRENVQDVARKMVGAEDEVRRPALLEHPMAKGRGRLAFRVALPPEENGDCVLAFEALLNHPKSSGAAFMVEVDGREVFARTLRGGEQFPAEVSLNEWRGREVSICFEVDALKDSAYDWTTWVAPRVLLRAGAKSSTPRELLHD